MRTLERQHCFLAAPAVGIHFLSVKNPLFLKENWGARSRLLLLARFCLDFGPLTTTKIAQNLCFGSFCYFLLVFLAVHFCQIRAVCGCRLYFWSLRVLQFHVCLLQSFRLYFWRFSAFKFVMLAPCRLYFWRFSGLKFVLLSLCRLYLSRMIALKFVLFSLYRLYFWPSQLQNSLSRVDLVFAAVPVF